MELLDKRKQTFEFFKFLHIVPYDSTDYSKFHSSCSVTKLCLIFCNPKDCSPPSSFCHGIFQARILYWAAISFSMGSSWSRDQIHISYVSCTGRWILYDWAIWEDFASLYSSTFTSKWKKKKFTKMNSHILKCTCFKYTIKWFLSELTIVQLSPQSSFRIFPAQAPL